MKVADYKALFNSEAGEILQALESGVMALESGADSEACIEDLFRQAHNLKGMSGAMGYDQVVEASHALESLLDRCRRRELVIGSAEADLLLRSIDLLGELVKRAVSQTGEDAVDLLGDILVLLAPMATRNLAADPPRAEKRADEERNNSARDNVVRDDSSGAAEDGADENRAMGGGAPESAMPDASAHPRRFTSTRVDLERLDHLMDLVGELIISRIRLAGIAKRIDSKILRDELSRSGRLISEIQKEVMEARLIPVGQVFQRMRRVVRDAARELGKCADLEISGAEIGLDRTVLEAMVDPLVHLLRNAVDHGIESPDQRAARGKPARAVVRLGARRERNRVVLEVGDDGHGIDLERVLARGKIEPAAAGRIGDEQLCRILTDPGFSTRDEVSRYSGRGVGLNVVRKTVEALGGTMSLRGGSGDGLTVSMYLPVNLSIIKALLFEVGGDVHALPVEYVRETLRVERDSFDTVMGREVFRIAGETVPVVFPEELFGLKRSKGDSRYVRMLAVDTGAGIVALVTGPILGQQDIVIKGLPLMIRGLGGISGATILGSGRIAFVWDPRFLAKGRCADESDRTALLPEDRCAQGTG